MTIDVTFRELQPSDLADLEWSGGPEHLRAVAEVLPLMAADEAEYVVGVPATATWWRQVAWTCDRCPRLGS